MLTDAVLFSVFSDLLINLSAGWFGAAVIVPLNVVKKPKTRLWSLLVNIIFGIVSVILAVSLRKQI